jgi:hypothetical protein
MKYFRLTTFLLLIVLLAAGCTDGGAGIFYSIEKEEKIANKALSDFLSAQRGVFLPSYSPADNTLFVAAGTLYALDADTSGQDWAKVSLPGSWYYTWQIAGNGAETLFAVLENRDGDAAALYSYDGTTWTLSGASFIGRPVTVWYENSVLFLMTAEEKSGGEYFAYRLYSGANVNTLALVDISSAGGLEYDSSGNPDASLSPFRDIAWDGGQFWYITAAGIYQGTAGSVNADITSAPSVSQYRRLYYAASAPLTGMYVSTADNDGDGFVYRYNAGWSAAIGAGTLPNDFAVITIGATDYLLLGEENGYLESTTGDSFSGESATIDGNYDNTGLDDTVINGFFNSSGADTSFYAMTSGFGLWRNTGGTWNLE